MGEFKSWERSLAYMLSKNPRFKKRVKKVYQLLNYKLHKKEYSFRTNRKIRVVGGLNHETFFGYYDKSPENDAGTHIIYHQSEFNTRNTPSAQKPIKIVLHCIESCTDRVIDETFAYNWQQGARLMWLTSNSFIYNVFSSQTQQYESRVYTLDNQEIKKLDSSIYDCYRSDYALTLNWSRLMRLRPDYGYRNLDYTKDIESYENDGIHKVDLNTGKSRLIISLRDLIDYRHNKSMTDAQHKINHIMIGPDGKNFIFLHRWYDNFGKRYDRLLVGNIESHSFQILADEGLVSHCSWKDNKTIVGYLKLDNVSDYYEISIENGLYRPVSNSLMGLGDGHPTVFRESLLFDSYPDRSRMKHLRLYRYSDDSLISLGSFKESFEFYEETRCDLHPRFNVRGDSVYFDSVHEGKRRLYKMEVNLDY